jgi:hypothetical protein
MGALAYPSSLSVRSVLLSTATLATTDRDGLWIPGILRAS